MRIKRIFALAGELQYNYKRIIKIRLGVYQFASTKIISDNLLIISKAVEVASNNGIRLIAFHKCSLCGYPSIESKIEDIEEL